ncbi:MAG: hypothetical protein ACREOE_06220 [Gemmatimonadales bacterium]
MLPVLAAHLEDRYHHLRELLRHASPSDRALELLVAGGPDLGGAVTP